MSASGKNRTLDIDLHAKPRGLLKIGVGQDGTVYDKDDLSPMTKQRCGFIRKPEERTWKQRIVAKILIRWWYVMEDWPPVDYDYTPLLTNAGLREVPIARWNEEDEEDFAGRKKCYQLSQFPGVFRNSNEDFLDFRPHETCPCYNTLIQKSEDELQKMLVTALKNQIGDLENSKFGESRLKSQLEHELREAQGMEGFMSYEYGAGAGGASGKGAGGAVNRGGGDKEEDEDEEEEEDEEEDDAPLIPAGDGPTESRKRGASSSRDEDDEPLIAKKTKS